MLLPLDHLLFPPNVPAGLDWSVIGHFAMMMRKTPLPCDPPIRVLPEGEFWRIKDGRHRVLAAMISGRSLIEAELDL